MKFCLAVFVCGNTDAITGNLKRSETHGMGVIMFLQPLVEYIVES